MTTTAEIRGIGPVFTTTAAVATDATVYDFDLANYQDTQVCNLEYRPSFDSTEPIAGSAGIITANTGSGVRWTSHNNSANALRYLDGGNNTLSKSGLVYSAGDTLQVGDVRHDTDLLAAISVDAVADVPAGQTYSGSLNTSTAIRLGAYHPLSFGISNIQFWNDITSYTDGYNLLNELQGP